jgi:hypothetical protein
MLEPLDTLKPLWDLPNEACYLGPVPGSEFGAPRTGHTHKGVDLNCPRVPLTPGRGLCWCDFAGLSSGVGGGKVVTDYGQVRGHDYQVRHYHFGTKANPLRSIYVTAGQRLYRGTVMGIAGDSGNAAAVHDHYETWVDGAPQDPLCYLRPFQVVYRRKEHLRVGLFYPKSVSVDVALAQERLRHHGYPLTVDGHYGPVSQDAMRHFQRSQGLTDDGIVGKQTWLALLDD